MIERRIFLKTVAREILEFMVASDNGHSSTKMIVSNAAGEETLIIQPSVVAPLLTRPKSAEADEKSAVTNLLDNMVVGINSPVIEMGGLYAVGNKASRLSNTPRNIDIQYEDKASNDIPLIMSLSLIACEGVQQYFDKHQEIPQMLEVQATYSAAIPAREYTPSIAKEIEMRYQENSHVVDVYVGEYQVTVTVNFPRTKITQEGNPAVYALAEASPTILEEYNKRYGTDLKNADLLNKKILIIDIGDGTTEWIYLVSGNPVEDFSKGERVGVGHSVELALPLFNELTKIEHNLNRQDFMQIIKNKEHKYRNKAMEAVNRANLEQVRGVLSTTRTQIVHKIKLDLDIVVVTGGGSIVFKNHLEEKLYKLCDELNVTVLWSPEELATTMNVEGSNNLNKHVFFV